MKNNIDFNSNGWTAEDGDYVRSIDEETASIKFKRIMGNILSYYKYYLFAAILVTSIYYLTLSY